MIVDVFAPSATTVVVPATTVEFPADVGAKVGADPSPGLSPVSFPSPTVMLNGAEKSFGRAKVPGFVPDWRRRYQ